MEGAAGIGGGDDLGAGGCHLQHLPSQQALGHLRVSEVVDATAAATLIWMAHLHQLQPGNGLKEGPGLGLDALSVGEVAGVLVGDHLVQGAQTIAQGQGCQEFVHILDQGAEATGFLGVARVVLQ